MSRTWSTGVLEYWGIKRKLPTFKHQSSTPVLQHSEIVKQLQAHPDYLISDHRSELFGSRLLYCHIENLAFGPGCRQQPEVSAFGTAFGASWPLSAFWIGF